MFTGTGDLSTPDVPVPPGGRRGALYLFGGCAPRGLRRTAHRDFLAVLPGLCTRTRGLLLNDLETLPFGGETLVVLAALFTSASQVPVITFFPGLLSGFLAYLYTWYCFPALSYLWSKIQPIPLEAIYSGLGLHVDMVPAL